MDHFNRHLQLEVEEHQPVPILSTVIDWIRGPPAAVPTSTATTATAAKPIAIDTSQLQHKKQQLLYEQSQLPAMMPAYAYSMPRNFSVPSMATLTALSEEREDASHLRRSQSSASAASTAPNSPVASGFRATTPGSGSWFALSPSLIGSPPPHAHRPAPFKL